jgi:hypothetical protein
MNMLRGQPNNLRLAQRVYRSGGPDLVTQCHSDRPIRLLTDGAFPIRRARIVAARLDTYRPSSPTASTWLRASETRPPPTWCAALRSGDIPHGSRSPDRNHNTDGQPLAYVYSRGSEAEARRAKMLTKVEARRIAVKVTLTGTSRMNRFMGSAGDAADSRSPAPAAAFAVTFRKSRPVMVRLLQAASSVP